MTDQSFSLFLAFAQIPKEEVYVRCSLRVVDQINGKHRQLTGIIFRFLINFQIFIINLIVCHL